MNKRKNQNRWIDSIKKDIEMRGIKWNEIIKKKEGKVELAGDIFVIRV